MSEDNSVQMKYQGMPLFAEVGPLEMDSFLFAESQKIAEEIKLKNSSKSLEQPNTQWCNKFFKIMSIHTLKRTKIVSGENPQSVEFSDSTSIQLIKKNMKVPSALKLFGQLTEKGFDIFKRGNPQNEICLKINYNFSLELQIIRHSTTKLVLKDKTLAGDSEFRNEVELSFESSYERDLFVLTFRVL